MNTDKLATENRSYVGISMISGGIWRIVVSFAIRNAAAAQIAKPG